MSETINGACLCGQVTFVVRDPEQIGVCHCMRCRRWTGGPGLTGIDLVSTNFEVTSGAELITHFFTEPDVAGFGFCSTRPGLPAAAGVITHTLSSGMSPDESALRRR